MARWKIEGYDTNNYIAYHQTKDILLLLIANDENFQGFNTTAALDILESVGFRPDVVVVG